MTPDLEARGLQLEHVWQQIEESVGEHHTVDELIVTLGLMAGAAPLGSLEAIWLTQWLNLCCTVEATFGSDTDAGVPWTAMQVVVRHVASSFVDHADREWL